MQRRHVSAASTNTTCVALCPLALFSWYPIGEPNPVGSASADSKQPTACIGRHYHIGGVHTSCRGIRTQTENLSRILLARRFFFLA